MTDLVEQKLAEFADSAAVPPLDVFELQLRANARSRRRRLGAAAAAAVVIAASGLLAPAAWIALRTDRSTQTASTMRGPAVPNEARLREVMASAGLPIRAVRSCCAGPIRRPDSTDPGLLPYVTLPWGADNRTMTAPELSNGSSEPVRVTWATVDPPLSDAEADRLARGLWPPDPDPVPDPHATRVGTPIDAANVRSVVYAYNGQLHAWAWSNDGGFAFLTAPGTPDAAPLATKLQQAARDLIRDDGGSSTSPGVEPPASGVTSANPPPNTLRWPYSGLRVPLEGRDTIDTRAYDAWANAAGLRPSEIAAGGPLWVGTLPDHQTVVVVQSWKLSGGPTHTVTYAEGPGTPGRIISDLVLDPAPSQFTVDVPGPRSAWKITLRQSGVQVAQAP